MPNRREPHRLWTLGRIVAFMEMVVADGAALMIEAAVVAAAAVDSITTIGIETSGIDRTSHEGVGTTTATGVDGTIIATMR